MLRTRSHRERSGAPTTLAGRRAHRLSSPTSPLPHSIPHRFRSCAEPRRTRCTGTALPPWKPQIAPTPPSASPAPRGAPACWGLAEPHQTGRRFFHTGLGASSASPLGPWSLSFTRRLLLLDGPLRGFGTEDGGWRRDGEVARWVRFGEAPRFWLGRNWRRGVPV
jgi:hypothetical protein